MGKTTTNKARRATAADLVGQVRQGWPDIREHLPERYKDELGQVFTELTSRVSYVCGGKTPQEQSKYALLDGVALAAHTNATIMRIRQEMPVEMSDIFEPIHELARRIEHAAQGATHGQADHDSFTSQTGEREWDRTPSFS